MELELPGYRDSQSCCRGTVWPGLSLEVSWGYSATEASYYLWCEPETEASAETKAFLDVNVIVECPNGEEVVTIARLDTAANTDVVSPKLASVLKSNQVQWSAKGGAYVEVCGASTVRPTGFLTVPIAVSSRQLGLPRRLHPSIDASPASWTSRGKMSRRDQVC